MDVFALKENDVLYDAAAIRLNQYLPLNTRAHGRLRLLQDPGNYAWSKLDSNVFNAGLTRLDLFIDGLGVTLLGNHVENENDRFLDVTGEIDYKISREISAAIGMTYTGYQFANVEYPDTLNGQSAVYNLADHIGSKIYFIVTPIAACAISRLKRETAAGHVTSN